MKYLVTGGAGFIGSNIVSELLKQGQQVVVLDNFATGKRENILPLMKNENLTMIEGDLRSFHIVRSAVKGVDYILHQGAKPADRDSINCFSDTLCRHHDEDYAEIHRVSKKDTSSGSKANRQTDGI